MTIGAYMLSCDARRESRERTLASLRASGWTGRVRIEIDRSSHARPQDRQSETSYLLLRGAVDEAPDVILFLEDDLEFNRHFAHNLSQWAPLRAIVPGGHFFASLYNPTISELERRPETRCFVARPNAVYGSQAFLLSLATARIVVERWDRVPGMQDIKMSRLAADVTPIYYHVPSLVQHVERSTWGGAAHTACDFDGSWRAPTLEACETAFAKGSV